MSRRALAFVLPFLAALTMTSLPSAAQAATTHTISGTVLAWNGSRLGGTTVTATSYVDNTVTATASTTTDASGHYLLTVPDAGDGSDGGGYQVKFTKTGLVTRFWTFDDSVTDRDTAGSTIPVQSDVTGVDSQLYAAGGLSGTATSGGHAVAGLKVTINRFPALFSGDVSTTTDSSGHYSFADLVPGSYAVNASPPADLADSEDPASAVGTASDPAGLIVVASGQARTVPAINVTPRAATGTVHVTTTTRARSLTLANASDPTLAYDFSGDFDADAGGTFVAHAPAGTYHLLFAAHSWLGGLSASTATTITVTAGHTTALAVTPPATVASDTGFQVVNTRGDLVRSAYVTVRPTSDPSQVIGTATMDGSNAVQLRGYPTTVGVSYTVSDPTGEYTTRTVSPAQLTDSTGSGPTVKQVVLTRATALPPTTPASGEATVDTVLTGVRPASHAALVPADDDTAAPVALSSTQSVQVPAGSYKIELAAPGGGLAATWYGGATFGSATTVTLVAGHHATLTLPGLPSHGGLGGVVRVSDDVEAPTFFGLVPSSDARADTNLAVVVHPATHPSEVVAQVPTNDGFYELQDLPVAPYLLEFIDPTGRHADRWYGGTSASSATAVTPRAGDVALLDDTVLTATSTPPPAALRSTGAPVVSGTPTIGHTLTGTKGTWSSSGLTYTYHWYRDGAVISGAYKSSYVVSAADWSKKLTVRVSAKRSDGSTAGATSAPTAAVRGGTTLKASATSSSTGSATLVSTIAVKGATTAKGLGQLSVSEGTHTYLAATTMTSKSSRVTLKGLSRGTHHLLVHFTAGPYATSVHVTVTVKVK